MAAVGWLLCVCSGGCVQDFGPLANQLRSLARTCDMLILWLDCDLEGEAIGLNERIRIAQTRSFQQRLDERVSVNPCSRARLRQLTAVLPQATK